MAILLGHTLRAAREHAGLTLQDAAHQTRIPVGRLQQLEGDDLAGFGSLTYTRSFLRQYCRFLDVDPSLLLERLPKGGLIERPQTSIEQPERWVTVTSDTPGKQKKGPSPMAAGLSLFVVLLLIAGFWGDRLAAERARTATRSQESRAQARVSEATPIPVAIPVAEPLTLANEPREEIARAIPVNPIDAGRLASE